MRPGCNLRDSLSNEIIHSASHSCVLLYILGILLLLLVLYVLNRKRIHKFLKPIKYKIYYKMGKLDKILDSRAKKMESFFKKYAPDYVEGMDFSDIFATEDVIFSVEDDIHNSIENEVEAEKTANNVLNKYYKMTCSIDLDNLPWTSVGMYYPNSLSGAKFFFGIFDR